jgi:hypothetical protein
MLATTLGLEFDPDKSWAEEGSLSPVLRSSTCRTSPRALSAIKGPLTTVVAAAVPVG